MLFKLKAGMGKHRIRRDGRMVVLKPGDEIDCERDELGGAIDKFEQLEPDPPPPEPKLGLKAVHRGAGKWDVVNEATGVKINDKLLTKEEAQELALSPPPDEIVEGAVTGNEQSKTEETEKGNMVAGDK